jgi:hypothetical protein
MGARKHPTMSAMDCSKDIENAGALVKVFGEWPSFHDAEVLEVLLRRGPGGPSLECLLHVFATTRDVDERGSYVTLNHTLVRIRFGNLRLYELKWFNHQNAIDELDVRLSTEGQGRFTVYLPSNWGCEAHFACDTAAVVSVEPYTERQMVEDGSAYANTADAPDHPSIGPGRPVG